MFHIACRCATPLLLRVSDARVYSSSHVHVTQTLSCCSSVIGKLSMSIIKKYTVFVFINMSQYL